MGVSDGVGISEMMERMMLIVQAGRFEEIAKKIGWRCLACDDELTEFCGSVFTPDMKPSPVCPTYAQGFKTKGDA